jgi:hypothetical protein
LSMQVHRFVFVRFVNDVLTFYQEIKRQGWEHIPSKTNEEVVCVFICFLIVLMTLSGWQRRRVRQRWSACSPRPHDDLYAGDAVAGVVCRTNG